MRRFLRWRVFFLVLVLVALLVFELRYLRECSPRIASLLARHRSIAVDARCDERTPLYAEWYGLLDCEQARVTHAKGYVMLMLECILSKHPFAAYGHLARPLAFPSLDAPHEFLMACAGLVLLIWLASALLTPLWAYWREERLRLHFKDELVAMRQSLRPTKHSIDYVKPSNFIFMDREASAYSHRARAQQRQRPMLEIEEIN
jgi:hypothetical protein